MMTEQNSRGGQLRKVGAMWKPKPGAKSLGTGSLTINGLRQRFVVLPNTRKKDGSNEPDYQLMSSDEPEADAYAQRSSSAPDGRGQAAGTAASGDRPF
jgi:hypothetical protein